VNIAGEHHRLADALLGPVLQAGRLQLAHRESGVAAEVKADASPVTAADRESEAILVAALMSIAPAVPVVAEEMVSEGHAPVEADTFFLVDPLDGTRDFVAGRPEFTINVSLVAGTRPVFGLIYAPALGELLVTDAAGRAVRSLVPPDSPALRLADLPLEALLPRRPATGGLVVLASPSRPKDPIVRSLGALSVREWIMAGSSYKFCLVATGRGDVYPQPGKTCEWDTAAGQAIVEAMGGVVIETGGRDLRYGKHRSGYLNPPFVAWGWPPGPTT